MRSSLQIIAGLSKSRGDVTSPTTQAAETRPRAVMLELSNLVIEAIDSRLWASERNAAGAPDRWDCDHCGLPAHPGV